MAGKFDQCPFCFPKVAKVRSITRPPCCISMAFDSGQIGQPILFPHHGVLEITTNPSQGSRAKMIYHGPVDGHVKTNMVISHYFKI